MPTDEEALNRIRMVEANQQALIHVGDEGIRRRDKMPYYLIYQPDRECLVLELSAEEVIATAGEHEGFLTSIEDSDPATWGGQALLIKGEIVVPKPAEIVKTWKVD